MCGIVGYIGEREASEIIYNGLSKLEYRGYDSAGIAVLTTEEGFAIRRDSGKLSRLGELLVRSPLAGKMGVGHTRWATHGEPNERNSHPHRGMNGKVVVVQNGIVENFASLKGELQAEGVVFASETDTEVIAQLVERYVEAGLPLLQAVRETIGQLRGANAIVVMSRDEPDKLVCARLGNAGGVAIGLGEGEMFVASDIPGILEHTNRIVFLENGQIATITRAGYVVTNVAGEVVEPEVHVVPWDPISAVKGEFKHFMQKEIFDQPGALLATMGGRVIFEQGRVVLPEMNLTPALARKIRKVYTVACGTSYYAGLVGKFLIESMARVPVEVEYASEFRYYDPIVDENTAVLSITQSGETADTLAASEQARENGAILWSIVNAIGSQSMRLADGYITMQAGPEIGVASTKAYTTSILDQYMLACVLGHMRGVISDEQLASYVRDLAMLPDLAGRVLDHDAEYQALAHQFGKATDFLFIGRGINYPTALEGALKLKEISYIHAEGYPAGEMKHGPIALIDADMPVVAIATQDELYEKMISQIQQAKARGGKVIAVATEGDEGIRAEADYVLYVPPAPKLLSPIINVIPLQLLSYHMAVWRGCDVDQPRNLAKSVTVE
jgi:glutamine---fructose-6-phosphate transaminase (isomerizing)